MTELTGTAKQVAWATDIREAFMADAATVSPTPERQAIFSQRATMLAESHTAATWWIEQRNGLDPKRALRTLAERTGKAVFGTDNWTPE